MIKQNIPIDRRFWMQTSVSPSCWNWTGHKLSNGYGHIRDGKKRIKAHRYAWMKYRGPIPDGKLVLHKCDNPACVNPDHLYLGTTRDNALDRERRHRYKTSRRNMPLPPAPADERG